MLELFLTSSALILAVLLIRALFGRRMGAGLRYGLWLLVLLRLLLPVSFGESAASPANLVRLRDTQGVILSTPVSIAPIEETGVKVDPDTGAVVDPNSFGYAVPTGDGMVIRYASRVTLPDALRSALPVIWLAGMIAAALWFAFCNLAFRRRLVRSRRPLEVEGKTKVYVADVPSPCVFGLRRPAIYVTEQAASDPVVLSQVLLHERTHLRHLDQLWGFCRMVCLVVWWFHPLVWVAASASRQDCELFCDEAVIRALGEDRRADYGRTLLALAGGRRAVPAFCAVSTLSGGGRSIKRRIRAIAHWMRPRRWAVIAAALLVLLAAGCAFTGAETPAEAPADIGPETEPEMAEAPSGVMTAAEAMDALADSIVYDGERAVSFTVPADWAPASDWSIVVAGRAAYADGMSMSLHPLDGTVWEAGETYAVDLDPAMTELILSYSLPGEPERSMTLWPLDGQPLISDADLVTADGLYLGIELTEAQALLGEPDVTYDDSDESRTFRKGGVFYAFTRLSDEKYHLTVITADMESGGVMPFGLDLGDELDDVLVRLSLPAVTALDDLPQVFYGTPPAAGSAQLERGGDGLLSISAHTGSGNYLRVTFDRESRVWAIECQSGLLDLENALWSYFTYHSDYQGARFLDSATVDDGAYDLLGVVAYEPPEGSPFMEPSLAFCIANDGNPYFHPLGFSRNEDSVVYEYLPETLRYNGNGQFTFDLRDPQTGLTFTRTVTYSSENGTTDFKVQDSTPE